MPHVPLTPPPQNVAPADYWKPHRSPLLGFRVANVVLGRLMPYEGPVKNPFSFRWNGRNVLTHLTATTIKETARLSMSGAITRFAAGEDVGLWLVANWKAVPALPLLDVWAIPAESVRNFTPRYDAYLRAEWRLKSKDALPATVWNDGDNSYFSCLGIEPESVAGCYVQWQLSDAEFDYLRDSQRLIGKKKRGDKQP